VSIRGIYSLQKSSSWRRERKRKHKFDEICSRLCDLPIGFSSSCLQVIKRERYNKRGKHIPSEILILEE
jgi:hypothetical protein